MCRGVSVCEWWAPAEFISFEEEKEWSWNERQQQQQLNSNQNMNLNQLNGCKRIKWLLRL